jgi:hypothetical protein
MFSMHYEITVMYLRKKDQKFRYFLKHKAEFDSESIEKNTIDFAPLPVLVEIFSHVKMRAVLDEHDRRSNLYRNNKRFLDYLGDTNGFLPLVELPSSIFDDLEELRSRFPNFSAVIDFYKKQFALSFLSDMPIFAANPLMILGPPGIGKTALCHELAKLVKAHFELISLSGMTASFVLGGMSSGWAEGKPGKIVEAMARSCQGNVLYVLDEIDKTGGDKRYDPLGVLLQLLEKQTAKSFTDEALESKADCSYGVYIATANYIGSISEPILSRFTVIEVSAPSGEQMIMVINSIYKKILHSHDWGEKFTDQLSPVVIDKIIESEIEPRTIQCQLISACGKVVLKAREQNSQEKSLFEISLNDLDLSSTTKLPIPNQPQMEQQGNNIFMPIFNVAPIQQESEETIVFWSVREVGFGQETDRSRHLVGYIPSKGTGRVTSAIQQFDPKSMTIKTRSGRIYHLKGHPGFNDDVEYVWLQWKSLNGAQEASDVTSQYCILH